MKTKGKAQIFLSRLLGKASRALHLIPPTLAMYSVEVTDEDGQHVSGYRSKSNSWVRNFMNYIALHALLGVRPGDSTSFFADGYLNFRNLSGTTVNQTSNNNFLAIRGSSAQLPATAGTTSGIVVGTSDAAESFESYALTAKVAHGNSSGQLYHNAQVTQSRTWNSSGRKWSEVIQRTFTNNSGATITVKEIGYEIILGQTDTSSYTSFYDWNTALIIRDVLSSPQPVNNGQTLTVTFTIEFPF